MQRAKVFITIEEQDTATVQLLPLKAQLEIYDVHVLAEGLDIISEHSLALQVIPAVNHPHAFPAPSVVALHKANVFNGYDVQAAATAQRFPLYAQVGIYAVQVVADELGIVSVHCLDLHVVPPVTHPQTFPEPSDVALHKAKLLNVYYEHLLGRKQSVPLKAQILRYAAQVAAFGPVTVSVHSLDLQADPPDTHPQLFPNPSLVILQRAKEFFMYDVQNVAATQFVPLKAQLDI